MRRPRKKTASVLDRVSKVRVVSWTWNARSKELGRAPGDKAIGVIAQELARIFPELVKRYPDGYRRVDYGGLAAIAIAGVQALRAEVDELRAQVSVAQRNAPSRRAGSR